MKNTFEAPPIAFLEKTGGRYYDRHLYDKTYNRPQEVENALIDFMPCYFKETAGGKRFYLREMKAGEEQVYHFAYMVDGDMTDVMYLCIDNNTSIDEERQYIVISGQ